MIDENENILDVIVPDTIYKDKDLFNDILLYIHSENPDTLEYYKAKVLTGLSDNDMLALYVLGILIKNNKSLYEYISKGQKKFFKLIESNINIELGDYNYIADFISDFDINSYVTDIRTKYKYEFTSIEDDKTVLILNINFIEYLVYIYSDIEKYKTVLNSYIYKLNVDVYDYGITNILAKQFKNSDVPTVNDKKFYILNKYMMNVFK